MNRRWSRLATTLGLLLIIAIVAVVYFTQAH
ncbi:hypothetical protein HNR17_002820 [Galbitalea soli]|nr:hypothetical protein [Galbitalea soli]